MIDKNHYAGYMTKYGIVCSNELTEPVSDELCNDCSGNDSGQIINPAYRPLFKQWLVDNDMPVECYIVWWSW